MTAVYIDSKTYGQAFHNRSLDPLATYVAIVKAYHGNKIFYFKKGNKTQKLQEIANKISVSYSTLSKHLKILIRESLATISETALKLKPLKEMKGKGKKKVFVPKNVNDIKDIKKLLKSIPFLSNLTSQQKEIDKKERYATIYGKISAGKFVSKNDFKFFKKKYRKQGTNPKFNSKLMLSVSNIGKLINRSSKNTIIKFKKFLKSINIINYFNEKQCLLSGIKITDFYRMQEYGYIPFYAFFKKGNVYVNKPSTFECM